MAKNNNLLWLGLAAVVALVAFKKPDAAPAGGGSGNGGNGSGAGSGAGSGGNGGGSTPVYNYPIFWNRYHPDVKLLQQALGNVNIDGYIGRETSAELAKYGIVFNSLSQIANSTALQIYINTINAIKAMGGGSHVVYDNLKGCNIC